MDRKENPFDQFDQEPANQFDQFEVTQSANPFDQFDQLDKVAAPVARGPIKEPAQRTVAPPAAAPVAPVTAEDYLEPATSAPPPLSEAVRSQLDRKYDALSPQDRDAIIRGRTKDGRQTLEGMYFAYRDKQFAARDADTAAFAKQLGPMAYRLSDLTDPRKESRARMAREQGASDKTAENIAAQAAIEGLPAEEVVPQAKESKFDFDLAARYKDLNPVVRGAVKGYYGYKQSVLGLNQALGDLVGATDFADTQRAGAETAGGRVESIGERPDYLSRNFEGAVSSVVQNIPGILGGIVTGGALVPLSVLGVQSFGQNYTEGVSRGLTRDLAAQRAGVFAAAEILGERFGLAGLTNGIRKAFGKKSFEEASDAVSRYIVSQIPGEQLTTATQFLADKYPSFALNPQAGIKEYLQQAGDTLTQTIMQGGLMMGGVKGAQFLATGRFGAEPGEQPPIAGRPPEEPPMAPTEEPPIASSGAPGGERIEPTVTAEPTITPERVEPSFGAEPTIEPAVEPEEPGVPGMVTTEMLAPEAVEQPEGQVAPAEPPVPSPIKPAVAPPQEPSNETTVDGMLPVNVPLKDLTLSKDVPQFKMGADTKGVVEPLGGKFERTGVAPIQVWRRLDGSLEVISGRHRLDLARRSGEKTIPAQIHDEAQGFTLTMAAILDAELNIRDEQGKVKDYVNYFKASGITPQDAESRGLLARSTGKRAYTIATTGSDELVAAIRNDQVGDEAAYYVALNAPNDPRLQSVGLKAIQDGKSANLAVNTMLAMKALGMENNTTTDMFGFDDSAMKEAAAMAQVANKKQREIQTRLAAISGAAKNPAIAKAEGIDIRDPEAVNRRIGELRQMKAAWDNWATNPELVREIREARGAEAPALTLRGETEEEIRAREEAAAAEEQRLRSEAEAARRAEQAEIERKRAEETTDLFQLGQTAEQQMSGMGDLFAAPAEAPAAAPAAKPVIERTTQPDGGVRTVVTRDGKVIKDVTRWKYEEIVADEPQEFVVEQDNITGKKEAFLAVDGRVIGSGIGATKLFEQGMSNEDAIRRLMPDVESLTLKGKAEAPAAPAKAPKKPAAEKAEPRADFDKRAKNAIDSFVDSIVEQFDMTPETALAAFNWLRSEKLAEVDPVLGKVNLKDGRFWDGEILRRAALETEAKGREPGATDEDVKAVGEVFEGARAGQEEELHRLFDKPKEVVRLTQKDNFLTPAEAKKRIAEWKKNAEAQGKTNANSDKVVLSLFDLTGAWSEPWLEAGYQVYRFDIQDQWTMTDERTGEELNLGDINNFSVEYFEDLFGNFEGNDVHAILAACPCTDFASSGARHFKAKDASGQTMDSVQLVQQTLATIEYFRPAIWAIENPVGRIEKLTGLPPWSLSFDPYMFGDSYTKKTLLWGRFNANLPTAPVDPVEGSKMHRMYGGKSLATKNARSVTPEGFAYAFFQANNAIDHPVMALANIYDRLNPKLFERAMKLGVSEQDIRYAIDDAYYSELDDAAAEAELVRLANEAQAAKAPKPKAEKPAEKPIAAKPAEKLPYTKEQREDAEIHAKEVGGEIAWQRGEYALIRGYSVLTGDPVYAPTIGSSRARVDISSFTGKQIPDDVKKEMLEAKERLEREAAEAHAANPFIKFKDGIALSEDIPADLAGVIRGWKDLLKLDAPIYVSTLEAAKSNRDKFTGPHRRIGSGTLDENERGSMRRMSDGSYYILFERSTSPSLMLETIAHEMGHAHQRLVYEKASDADKAALQEAHKRWLESQKGKTAKELVEALRTRATGRQVKGRPGLMAEDLTSYWKSFSEWYADQTARWAVSAEAPVSVVEKFFKRLGNQLRRFYQSLRGQKYLPDETFREFIERTISPTYMGPSDATLPSSDEAQQQLRDIEEPGTFNVEEPSYAGLTTDRISRLLSAFAYPRSRSDTKAFIAYVNPADFVDATSIPSVRQRLEEEIRPLYIEEMREIGPIYLKGTWVDNFTKFIPSDHDGRHRMLALRDAGVTQVPVVFISYDRIDNAQVIKKAGVTEQRWGNKDLNDIYRRQYESQIKGVRRKTVSFEKWLKDTYDFTLDDAQKFGSDYGISGFEITNAIPVSYNMADKLKIEFGGRGDTELFFNVEPTKPTGWESVPTEREPRVNKSQEAKKKEEPGLFNIEVPGKRDQATWSSDRVDMLVREFQYTQQGRENDTKAYAAFIDPAEFVRATTAPGEFRKELLRAEEGLNMKRLREERQTPFLTVEFVPGEKATWRIEGHEGRHRMAALAASGVKRVPVLIRMAGEAKAWLPVKEQWLSGQKFGPTSREKGDAVQITDLTPISFARRDGLQKKFAGEGIAFSIERPEAKTTKRMSDEDIRDEQIREYSALRQRLAAVPRRIAAGKGALPDGPAKGMTELERVYLKSLVDRAQDLKAAIKISAPRLDSPEQFLARALKEYDAGNISKEVLNVIQAAYKQQPGLLNGLKLSIKQAPEGAERVAGAFLNMSRIVRLYKGSSGVDDPKTIRHELTHSLEQMMTPEQRGVIIDKWQDDLAKAIRKHKDAAHQKYFEALLKFFDKPTMENYKAAIAALPSYDMYQFITPSEYWAVNAENLMASQLGGPWQRFKAAMKRMFEALKDVFGFDNKYVVQRAFKDIMTGSKERVTTEMLADRAGIAVSPAQNIKEDKALIEKYKRPKTPMLDKKPLATFLLDQFKNGKDLFKDFVENPKEAAADAGNSLIDGALRARMATVWYGAGLESRDFAKYGGQLRTSEDLATASVALDNAIRSGNIGVEVIFRGGLKFDNSKKQLVAVETKKGMRGVYEAERRLKDKLGNQLGTDIIQGYLEAKRSISIMNEFYDRQAAYEGAKENLKMLRERGASEKKIKEAVALMEGAERSLESVKKAVSSVTMTEDEMYDFAARDKVHPELREIMDNWTAVNQNLLRIWRDVGLLSPERYEALASIPDYVPWYRIMQDEEDPHTPLMSTTRGLTNIGREKLFKRTKPTDVLDFKGKEGKKVLDESGNLIGMSFKVPPSTVLRVEVDGENIKAKDLSVTDDGRVMVKAPIDDASLVVFKVTRPIQNIVDNMTQNVMRMTMNAIRQYAAGRIVSEYATRDPQGRVMTFPKEDLAKGRFSFVINGQRKVVEISDPLPLGAIYGMDSLNLKMYALPAAFANFFRRTITLSGVFQLKQVFKDAPTAAAVTGVRNPAALILGTYKGLITALLQPVGKKVGIDIEPAVDILKAAGIGGFQNPSRTPEAEVKRRLGIMNRNVFDFVIKGLDHIGDSADMAQRIAVYKRVMAETGNETQALYQAANVINFLHHGSSGTAQTLVKTVPFMGAYANAMDVLVNSLIGGGLKGMSRRKAIARLGVTTGMLIGITLLYTMLVSGDDDYEELDDQTKLRNFIIPGTDIMLPMNTSYAFFWKAMTEMLYNEAIKKATPNEIDRTRLKKALSTAARDMLLGPEPVPQIIKGPAEIAIGYNFFTGRDIIPEGLKNVEAFQQYTATTSELGKWLSSYTEAPGTDGKRILSPIEADHLIRSTFGTAGALGQWVTNRIAVEAGTRPELTEKETPITGAFLRPEVDRGREDLFYDLRDRVNQKYNTLRELERDDEKKAETYEEKYEDLLDMHKDVNKIAADLSDINAEIRELSTSKDIKMTPAERRAEIRALQQEKKEVLDDIYELRKEAGL